MRRQKRDKATRAYTRGYQAGVDGRSKSLCPYNDLSTRQYWLSGWRDGREDNWTLYAGASSTSKVAVG